MKFYSIDEIRDAVYETLATLDDKDYEKMERIFWEFKRKLEGE